jgi:hypothetical protein
MSCTKDELIQTIEAAANFCRGMALDPSVPSHAKEACQHRAAELDKVTARALSDEDDFLSGSKACDMSGENTCESCQ